MEQGKHRLSRRRRKGAIIIIINKSIRYWRYLRLFQLHNRIQIWKLFSAIIKFKSRAWCSVGPILCWITMYWFFSVNIYTFLSYDLFFLSSVFTRSATYLQGLFKEDVKITLLSILWKIWYEMWTKEISLTSYIWQVFMGSGVGDPFGPRCNKGDIMGCGVLFPRDFEFRSDSEEEAEQPQVPYNFSL